MKMNLHYSLKNMPIVHKASALILYIILFFISGKCGTGPAIIAYDGQLQGTFSSASDCPPTEASQAPKGDTLTGIQQRQN